MHDTFMRRAFALARQSLDTPGAMPFGAVVVRDGQIIGEGVNRSMALNDPTSHGEIEAVRDACRRLATTRLDGAVVYTTCEPCAMCVSTMYLAGIDGVFYASNLAESGAIMGRLAAHDSKWQRKIGADDLRRETGLPLEARRMAATRVMPEEGTALLEAFVRARMGG